MIFYCYNSFTACNNLFQLANNYIFVLIQLKWRLKSIWISFSTELRISPLHNIRNHLILLLRNHLLFKAVLTIALSMHLILTTKYLIHQSLTISKRFSKRFSKRLKILKNIISKSVLLKASKLLKL